MRRPARRGAGRAAPTAAPQGAGRARQTSPGCPTQNATPGCRGPAVPGVRSAASTRRSEVRHARASPRCGKLDEHAVAARVRLRSSFSASGPRRTPAPASGSERRGLAERHLLERRGVVDQRARLRRPHTPAREHGGVAQQVGSLGEASSTSAPRASGFQAAIAAERASSGSGETSPSGTLALALVDPTHPWGRSPAFAASTAGWTTTWSRSAQRRWVNAENADRRSRLSPKNSARTGSRPVEGKMSGRPPRTENWPRSSTVPARS